jgi:hypothetical protein
MVYLLLLLLLPDFHFNKYASEKIKKQRIGGSYEQKRKRT